MRLLPLIAALGILFLNAGCAQLQLQLQPQEAVQEQVTEKPKEELTRPFEAGTLYDLLVAEVAGHRNRFDIALGNYLQQAHETKDPGVAERAAKIAQYVGADQAALDAALLWADADKDSINARHSAAIMLTKAKRFEEAIEHFKYILEKTGHADFPFLASVTSSLKIEEREPVMQHINVLLAQYPNNIQLLFARAMLLQQNAIQLKTSDPTETLKLSNEALSITQSISEMDQPYPNATDLTARILRFQNKDQAALDTLAAGLERHPNSKKLHISYARLLVDNGKLDAAIKEFSWLVKKNPEDGATLLSLALVHNEKGNLEEAKALLSTLTNYRGFTSDAHFYLGRIASISGDHEAAISHFESVKAGPNIFRAQTFITGELAKLGKVDDARARLKQAREKSPEQAVRFYLAEAELLVGEKLYQDAQQALNEALTEFPEDSNLLYTRAMNSERLDDLEKAEADLRTILSQDTNNSIALNALGYTLANKTTRFEEALELIEQALALQPNDPAIIDSMGWVQFRLGNTEKALEYITKAFNAFPDQEVAAHLAEIYWIMGDKERAQTIIKEGLERQPESTMLNGLIERLEQESKQP